MREGYQRCRQECAEQGRQDHLCGFRCRRSCHRHACALAGRTKIDELNAAGKANGKTGIVSVSTANAYKDGDAAASQEAATGFISGNGDLVGLYGANEGSTVGVGNAIKASGKPIIGIGFDKSDAILGLLKSGALKAAMAQNPYTMGYLGVAQAYAALADLSTGPAVIDTGVAVLRK